MPPAQKSGLLSGNFRLNQIEKNIKVTILINKNFKVAGKDVVMCATQYDTCSKKSTKKCNLRLPHFHKFSVCTIFLCLVPCLTQTYY